MANKMMMMDEVRPLVMVSTLCSLQCFDADGGWVAGSTSARKPCSLIHLPSGAGRGGGTEEEPADQVHSEKRQLNGNSSCNRFKANFNKSSTVAETGHRLATIDMGRKVGRGCWVPFRGGSCCKPRPT